MSTYERHRQALEDHLQGRPPTKQRGCRSMILCSFNPLLDTLQVAMECTMTLLLLPKSSGMHCVQNFFSDL